MDKIDIKQIQRIIHSISPNVSVLETKKIFSYSNLIFDVRTDKDDYVIKVYTNDEDVWKAQKEDAIYTIFRKKRIPAPHIVGLDSSKSVLPYTFVLMTKIPGNPFSDCFDLIELDKKIAIYRELGDLLGRIHSITFESFGDIKPSNGELLVGPMRELIDSNKGPFRTWGEMHLEIVKYRLNHFRGTNLENLVEPVLNYFRENQSLIDFKIVPRLLHLDLNRKNIFINNSRISGIVDVEGSFVGHNEEDLMRTMLANFESKDELYDSFLEAYTKHVAIDEGYEKRLPFYFLSRSLVQADCLILFKDKYAKGKLDSEKVKVRRDIQRILTDNTSDYLSRFM